MNTVLHPPSRVSPSITWSIYAGLYAFGCGAAMAFLLSDVLILLGDALGLPAAYSLFILAGPSLVIGAIVWWTLVERRDSYTYIAGGAFGLSTALLTGLLWIVRFAGGWGLEMLLAIRILVGFVLGVSVAVGVLAGLPLMYARRRLDAGDRTGRNAG